MGRLTFGQSLTDAVLIVSKCIGKRLRYSSIAQAMCFDSKRMAQPFVLTENSFKFSAQNNMRALCETRG
jgi:hypothetical protein